MKVDVDGMPVIEPSATALGVREGEIVVRDGLVSPGEGGMSVADIARGSTCTPAPFVAGRTGKHPVFALQEDQLPDGLTARRDPNTRRDPALEHHWFIEPSHEMPERRYVELLASTRPRWRRILEPT
jgi:hypothetical protein